MKVTLLGYFPYKSKKTGKDSVCCYVSYKQGNVTGEATAQCFLVKDNFLIDDPENKIGCIVEADMGFNNMIMSISE